MILPPRAAKTAAQGKTCMQHAHGRKYDARFKLVPFEEKISHFHNVPPIPLLLEK
jgi:hypothetical protein